jgi:hypothetical protein
MKQCTGSAKVITKANSPNRTNTSKTTNPCNIKPTQHSRTKNAAPHTRIQSIKFINKENQRNNKNQETRRTRINKK